MCSAWDQRVCFPSSFSAAAAAGLHLFSFLGVSIQSNGLHIYTYTHKLYIYWYITYDILLCYIWYIDIYDIIHTRTYIWNCTCIYLLIALPPTLSLLHSCWSPYFPSNSPSAAFILYIHIFRSRFSIWEKTHTICLSSIKFLFHWLLQIVILLLSWYVSPYVSLDSAYRENIILIILSLVDFASHDAPQSHPVSCKSHNCIYYGWVKCVCHILPLIFGWWVSYLGYCVSSSTLVTMNVQICWLRRLLIYTSECCRWVVW